MPLKTVLGGFLGYCVGVFIKRATMTLAFYCGMGTVSIAILVKLGYITVNWDTINNDVIQVYKQTS